MGDQKYEELPVDRVVTVEEAVDFKKRTASRVTAKEWRFQGNLGSGTHCTTVANQTPPQGAGEVVIAMDNGAFTMWLYY
ncbi:hypothetical protein ACFRIC_41145 [Streptomyces sp. NPDC056738]|uniref:hypothetical protein n=1 Tax=Streptomyces sp. NPDC056738 TaxID=3345933 RepID=UPI0036B1C038